MICPRLLFIPMFLLLSLPLSGEASGPSCTDCHPDKSENAVVHPAVAMGCDSCHTGTHMGERPAPKLIVDVPDLCFNCHDRSQFEKKTLHAPVAGGMCGTCHDPHGGSNPRMLSATVPDLCYTCHSETDLTQQAKHVKAATGQCLTCHDPHGSDAAFVLTQLMEAYCQSCHTDMTATHVMARISPNDAHPLAGRPDPLRKGRELSCSSCHNPHAYDEQRISTRGLSSPAVLCLRCHRKIAVVP